MTERRVRLDIDFIACDGYGYCADLMPEHVELDDWGYPMLIQAEVEGDALRRARRAARVCPVAALRLAALNDGALDEVRPPTRRHPGM